MRPVIWSFGSFLFSAAPKKHWHSQFFASPLATPFPCLHDFPAQPRGGFSEKTLMDGQKGFPAKKRRGWMLYIYEPVKTLTPHTLPNLLISEERKRLSLAYSFSFSPQWAWEIGVAWRWRFPHVGQDKKWYLRDERFNLMKKSYVTGPANKKVLATTFFPS